MKRVIEYIKGFIGIGLSRPRLWLGMLLVSILSIIDIPTAHVFGFSGITIILYIICVGSFKATLIVGCFLWSKKRRILYFCSYVLIVLYTLLAVINAAGYIFYGFGISRRLMVIAMQTNQRELFEFIDGFGKEIVSAILTPTSLAVIASVCIAFCFITKIPRKIFKTITGFLSLTGLIVLICFSLTYTSGRTANFMIMRVPKYAVEVYKSEKEIEKYLSKLQALPDAGKVSSHKLAANIIMVIGESASRGHHSIYGYPLQTTPCLDRMRDSLFVFADAIGSSSGTASNMERILSFKQDDETVKEWYEYPLIIDLFREAGYRCYWLSNQERIGLMSNASGAMVSHADIIRYLGSDSSEDMLVNQYDDVLLPVFKEYFSENYPYKFIGLHLLGSHIVYSKRYPENKTVFKSRDVKEFRKEKWLTEDKAQTIAEYDNSIHFTDSILGEIILSISKSEAPSVLVYISDHGENVYDDRDFLGRDEKHVEIPCIIYVNDAYRRNNTEIVKQLEKAISYPISTANMIYPLMTISGTSYSWDDPENNFLSEKFKPRIRYVDESPWKYDRLKP